MNKVEQQSRVVALRQYLNGLGTSLSMVQGYEVLALSNGFKNRHVMAATLNSAPSATEEGTSRYKEEKNTLPRFDVDTPPYTLRALEGANWSFAVLMAIPSALVGYPEALASFAASQLTGTPCELSNFECVVAAYSFPAGYVAMEIRGKIANPEALAEALVSEVQYYQGLTEVVGALLDTSLFSTATDGADFGDVTRVHKEVDLLVALKTFAESGGKNEAELDAQCEKIALTFESNGTVYSVSVEALKFARKTGKGSWFVPEGMGLTLQF